MSHAAEDETLVLPDPRAGNGLGRRSTVLTRELLEEGSLKAFQPSPLKRGFDVVASTLLLLLTGPLTFAIAVAIKLDSRGPIIYSQERVGINRRRASRRIDHLPVPGELRRVERRQFAAEGRPFPIYKFRTMVANAETNGPTWARKNDPRITRVGKVLRATRLDELPQLVNVLRGDMSLVGPRPERPHFVNKFANHIPRYRSRLFAKPGITGLAQITHRYDSCEDDVRRKLDYDLEYMKRHSFAHDFWILVKTFFVMLTGRGAH